MRRFLISLSALAFAACVPHSHSGEGVEISNARINPPLPGQTTGVAFMSLINYGEDDRLLTITSSVSDRVELHTHLNDDGIMKMRRVDGIDLPHHKAVDLKPGGLHIMLFDTSASLGEDVVLTLDFEKADDLTVVAPVVMRGEMSRGDKDHGSHSGH